MYYKAQADIEAMLDEHAPLPAIESYLDARRELSDDEQAALWLFARVRVERCRCRPWHSRRAGSGAQAAL